MPKPENIQYSKQAIMIDGVQAHRVQRFGSSGDTSREKIQELTNDGAVEWRSNTPVVSITMDTNDVGSIDTLALVADTLIDKAQATETDGPRGGIYRWYVKAASANASNRPIVAADILDCYCDIIAPITEDGVDITRSMWIHRAALTGLSWSYDVNGFATENYTLTSDNKRWFLNNWKYARIYKPHNTAQSASGDAVTQTWTNMASAIPAGSEVLYFCNNDQIYGNANVSGMGSQGTVAITDATAYGNGTITVSTSGSSLDSAGATDNAHFVYLPPNYQPGWTFTRPTDYLTATAPGYDITSTSGAFGGVTREYVNLYLYNTQGPFGETTSTTAGVALRLQTVNIDGSSTEEQLLQLSQKRAYGVSRIDPTFTVTVTANDSDLELFAAMCATSEGSADTFSIDDFNAYNQLLIKVYKEEAKSTLLRETLITGMVVSGENQDVSVGGNVVQEFTFTADNITVTGQDSNVTGY